MTGASAAGSFGRQTDVDRAPSAGVERLEVAERLCRFQHAERERLPGHRQIRAWLPAVMTTNTPVLGPPLCSWPVECR